MDSSGRQWDDQGSALEGTLVTRPERATGTATGDAGSQLDYLRMRALEERRAAAGARDVRVRRVHLEMAERYEELILTLERPKTRLRLVS